jgi:hypothetical protein
VKKVGLHAEQCARFSGYVKRPRQRVTLFRRTCYEVLMDDWVNRLLLAAEKDGRSDRAISLAAGLGPNFLNELRNLNKAPTVPKVVALANELNVSLS